MSHKEFIFENYEFIDSRIRNYLNNSSRSYKHFLKKLKYKKLGKASVVGPFRYLETTAAPGIVLVVKNSIHTRRYAFANFLAYRSNNIS